jgi:hypothetical protein
VFPLKACMAQQIHLLTTILRAYNLELEPIAMPWQWPLLFQEQPVGCNGNTSGTLVLTARLFTDSFGGPMSVHPRYNV